LEEELVVLGELLPLMEELTDTEGEVVGVKEGS
jgi:hypothetical protein